MQEDIKNAERIVIKIGTSTLAHPTGRLNLRRFEQIVTVISDLKNMGKEIVIVSSGAIGVGAGTMGLKERPREKIEKQAAAAVGQCSIMYWYDKFFGDYDKTIAQILLNADDIEDEEKKENITNTFDALLEMGIIPVVNENDSVSYKEIESEDRLFGDNDMLSAVVAVLCKAQKLIILSDIDGMYDSDPRLNLHAKLIEKIEHIDENLFSLAGSAGSRRGTGGMKTKLGAAHLATSNGTDVVITNGKHPDGIYDIVAGKSVGTLFVGQK